MKTLTKAHSAQPTRTAAPAAKAASATLAVCPSWHRWQGRRAEGQRKKIKGGARPRQPDAGRYGRVRRRNEDHVQR